MGCSQCRVVLFVPGPASSQQMALVWWVLCGNEAVTALGSLSSPECDSPEMCQERVREE